MNTQSDIGKFNPIHPLFLIGFNIHPRGLGVHASDILFAMSVQKYFDNNFQCSLRTCIHVHVCTRMYNWKTTRSVSVLHTYIYNRSRILSCTVGQIKNALKPDSTD